MLKKLIKINPELNYTLRVEFEDGISGVVDLSEFIQEGIFKILSDKNLFKQVFITKQGAIAWNEELEISADTIYFELSKKSFDELTKPKLQDAQN